MKRQHYKVLLAKPGLDGHERGVLVVGHALRNAGLEVIYTGLHQTPAQIVASAIQEDVDVIGLSCHTDNHRDINEQVLDLLKDKRASIPIVLGGVIPEEDFAFLREIGVAGIFGVGSRLEAITEFTKCLCAKRASGGDTR